jgi:rhamnosyltransferase
MSTYNGQKYIREQIDSLLVQEGVTVRIVIRDDGSKDQTPTILSEYASKYNNIVILSEINCGAEESFNRLCRYALKNETSDYYAFCDQDDVWDTDKLYVAISKLQEYENNRPNLYFSNLRMVDENLNYIRDFYARNDVFTDRQKTLVQVFTYGCTCVFNRSALAYYCQPSSQKTHHDVWLYCLCSYLGNVYYDYNAHIQYRQHNNNLSGHRSKGASLFLWRIKRVFKGNLGHTFETIAQQLLTFKPELNTDDFRLITQVANYRHNLWSRLYLLFFSSFSSGNFVKDLCIKFRIIINKL